MYICLVKQKPEVVHLDADLSLKFPCHAYWRVTVPEDRIQVNFLVIPSPENFRCNLPKMALSHLGRKSIEGRRLIVYKSTKMLHQRCCVEIQTYKGNERLL